MSESIKYYKVIGADNKSCHGGDFDWTEYLPNGDKPGKWTPKINNIKVCECGYHVTRYWNMWIENGFRVFECEVRGKIAVEDVVGVEEKIAAESIRLVKELFDVRHLISDKTNTGDWNIGHHNTGDRNNGNRNTGDRSVGDSNAGDRNQGNNNTGSGNTGHGNSGNRNIGNGNNGNYNNGDNNIGNWNTGDNNIGNWNKADWCIGRFNTITSDGFTVFNKPCTREAWESCTLPDFITFNLAGSSKEAWRLAYGKANNPDRQRLVQLPNFDPGVFYEISGIRVDPKTGQEVK